MVYQSITVTIAAGKQEEAMQWMKKMAQYEKAHFGLEIQLFEAMDGIGGRHVWVEKHDSFASWERQDKLFWSDPGSMALLKEGEGLFSLGESHFWRDVDLSA